MGHTPGRDEGFAPIGAYGVVGDGRSLALVAADGAIDWWAAPAMDDPPVFGALLDPDTGGSFALTPAVPYEAQRRYLPDTNVLETTFTTEAGAVRVVDALTRDVDGLPGWAELVREVRPVHGEVPMRWRVSPGTRLHRGRPWAWDQAGTPVLRTGGLMAALVTEDAGRPSLGHGEASGEFLARPGQRPLLALVVTEHAPVQAPRPGRVRERLQATGDAWRRWSGALSYHGPDRDLVVRSALTLKALTYAPTGALMAAGTTSLPERIGGRRNFDYRFGWIRDTSFALEALIRLGLEQQTHHTLSWMIGAIRGTAPDIKPFYTLSGGVPGEQAELPARGYRGSRPVHDGNQAASQRQWGNYGDLLECICLAVELGGAVLDPETARMLEPIADRVCDRWMEPDSGIWELGEQRHYTISKLACWTALDRMVRLAERGQVTARDVPRWRAEAAAIHAWVDEHCWSAGKRAYTFYAGTADLDASVLLAGRMGFLAGDDPRFGQTIDAIRGELGEGALMYRYTGAREQEGAFVACSFWLADALIRAGRGRQAREVWKGVTGIAGETGLFSEEIDPASGEQRGNVPQALSHLALLTAAWQISGDQEQA